MQKIAEKLSKMNCGKILDIATGRGEFVHLLQHSLGSFDEIVGIDTDERMLKMAEGHFKEENISFKKVDAEKTEFEDDSFDVVAMSNSLHHMNNLETALAEMKRVSNNYIFINEMTCDEGQTEPQNTHILFHHWAAEIDRFMGRFHNVTYTKAEFREIIEKLALAKVEYFEYVYPVENPLEEKLVEQLTKTVNHYLNVLKDKADSESLIEKGKKLRTRIKEIGFASANSIFVIAEKR